MSRWKASAIHAIISIVIAAIVGSLIYFIWYPPPYFRVAGGSSLIVLIMGVDVVIGPLLTLAVFRSGKRGLKFDLAVIGLLQSAAFCYGMYVIVVARPVFIAAVVDRFVPVYANALDDQDLEQASRPEFAHRSWTGPLMVAAVPPKSGAETGDVIFGALKGKDVDRLPKYYQPYADGAVDLLKRTHTLDELAHRHPDDRERIEAFAAGRGVKTSDLAYAPLEGRTESFTMILDKTTGLPLGVLPIDPW